jgi:hypothetical protein
VPQVETGKGEDALDRRPQLGAALKAAKAARAPVMVAKLDQAPITVVRLNPERDSIQVCLASRCDAPPLRSGGLRCDDGRRESIGMFIERITECECSSAYSPR